MASLITESFEGGSNGANITTSNTGADTITGPAPTFTNSSAAAGTLAASFNASAAQSMLRFNHTASSAAWYVFRVRLTAMPAALTYITSVFAGATKVADVRINTDGTLTVRDNVAAVITSTGTALTTGAWHRIALRVQPGTAATGLQLKVYLGNGNTTPNYTGEGNATVTGTLDNVRLGVVASATFAFLLDDVEADDTIEPDGYSPPVITELFEEDFEGGSDGAALTIGNTSASLILGTPPTFTTTHHGTGALAAQASASASTSAVQWEHDVTDEAWYVWRVRLLALPEVSTYIFTVLTPGGVKCADLRINDDGTLTVRDNNSPAITSTVALTTGAWHRIALRVVPDVSLDLKVYLGDAVDADYAGSGVSTRPGDIDRARFGVVANGTLTYQFDTIAADSATEPDGGGVPVPPVETDLITELFEGGTNGANITTSNTSATAIVGTVPTFSTTAVQGGLSAHFATTATQSLLRFSHAAAEQPWYSFYMHLPTLPAATTYIAAWFTASNVTKIADLRVEPTGALVVRDNVTARITSTALLTPGHWHRISMQVTPGSELRLRVYLGPNRHNPSPSFEDSGVSSVAGDVDAFRIGVTTAATLVLNIDRILANTAVEPEGLPPVTTPVWFYEHPTRGWEDVTNSIYYEHPTRGWELVDPTY